MTLGELIDRVQALLGCDASDAFKVAQEIHTAGREDYSDEVIQYAAAKLGVRGEKFEHIGIEDEAPTPLPELSMDPAVVLREVYLACPRMLIADDEGKTHIPRLGRAPQEEQHAIDPEWLEQVPEEMRVLLLSVDVFNATAEVVMYDEANGVDRKLPPIDLTRFTDGRELGEALDVLGSRIPKYLAADWN
jgi:hypothetical protein